MSKKKKERQRRIYIRLRNAKASVGSVLEQCSNPELDIVIRFLERKDYDSSLKIMILSSAAYDIRATRRSERIAERAAARKLNRPQKSDEPVPQVPVPDSPKSTH
jgi:hypothetical protein